jgi:hypothetical protein
MITTAVKLISCARKHYPKHTYELVTIGDLRRRFKLENGGDDLPDDTPALLLSGYRAADTDENAVESYPDATDAEACAREYAAMCFCPDEDYIEVDVWRVALVPVDGKPCELRVDWQYHDIPRPRQEPAA